MAKGYWITTYKSISDMSKVEAYAKLAGPAIEAQGGVYLARGIAVATYEAGIKERTVLSVFPSVDAAIAAHDSPGWWPMRRLPARRSLLVGENSLFGACLQRLMKPA